MKLRTEINCLIVSLKQQAVKERLLASEETTSFVRGLDTGYASALELCAQWLEEILEEEE